MSTPLDPTILDLLRGSAMAPMLDKSVNDVLKDMGLPPLPQIGPLPPLPDMPPMPVLDLTALARPLTDMASSFGTGALGSTPGLDPTQMLTGITTALQTAMTLGSTAMQTVMQLWQGMGSTAAAGKAGAAAANGSELVTQGTQEKAGVGNAAFSVGVGAALLTAVIDKFMAQMAAAVPLLSLPGGQAFMVATIVEAIDEATVVVAKTRAELTVHSVSMASTGEKVPVTGAPQGANSIQSLQQIMQMLQPLMQVATTGAQAVGQLASAGSGLLAPKPIGKPLPGNELEKDELDKGEFDGGAPAHGPGPGPGALGGLGVPAPLATPLSPWTGSAGIGSSASSVPSGSAAVEPASAVRSAVGAPGPGMMPMGGAAGAASAARGAGDAGGGLPGMLVNAQHGDEVVGNIEGVSLPVVGAAEAVSEPPPDKELTL